MTNLVELVDHEMAPTREDLPTWNHSKTEALAGYTSHSKSVMQSLHAFSDDFRLGYMHFRHTVSRNCWELSAFTKLTVLP